MPSKLKRAIRAVKDQTSISIAKVSPNTSSNIEVPILKATTHEDVPIDEKYVNEILRLVSSSKTQAAVCARTIAKRIGRTRNWIVALKSLMLVLRIFQDGDPYFPREVLHAMKRGAKILNLSSFRDDSNSSPWDFTAFVRTFALYLDERLECFLTGKLQGKCSMQETTREKGHERSKSREGLTPNENVGDMKPAMLLDKISYWQRLLDRAIATRPTGVARTNRLVQIALNAIVQESFDLYKDISEGLTHLLDSFFHLQYQNCVTAFQTCIKASKQFEELGAFYTLCKSIGVGRSPEYPSVRAISEELIDTLQEFLKDQSSFSSHVEPFNQRKLLPAPPASIASQSSMHESDCGQSEFSITSDGQSEFASDFGSQCTSLEDLISATQTGTSRAISIDLEEYPATKADMVLKLCHAGSSKSLPVTNSMTDLVSLDDSSDDENEQPNGLLASSTPNNWELMLVETLSTPTATPVNDLNKFDAFPSTVMPEKDTSTFSGFPSTTMSNNTDMFSAFPSSSIPENNTDAFNAFPSTTLQDNTKATFEAFPSTTLPENTTKSFNAFPPTTLPDNTTKTFNAFPPTTLPDNNTNTFNAFPEQTQNSSTEGLELVLFEPSPPQQSTVPNNKYNPFLQDTEESSVIPAPTFQAAPTFSAQNQSSFLVQNDNDPFNDSFSVDQVSSGTTDQENVLQQQELWLRNQNKIIAKHML